MLSTCTGLSSGLCPEWLARYLTTHIPLVRRGLWITTVQPLLARSNDVRRTVGSPVTAGGSVCAITSPTHDGGPQVRLQRDENATPMLPSITVVASCARTPRVTLSADVPLSSGVMGHDDQTWSRQAPEWAPMGVSPANSLVPLAGSELRRRVLSASAARLEELYRAMALTDGPRELGTTSRWAEPEHRALEESYGAPA
jgi:hypothetical protein